MAVAILDFMADRFPRAPKLWRRLRLEWLFRLRQEPRRLWQRYTVEGALFLFYTAVIIYTQKYKRGQHGFDCAVASMIIVSEYSGANKKQASMEVVHIVRQYKPSVGGLEDAVQNLCVCLAHREGIKVRIITLDRVFTAPNKKLPQHEVLDGISVTRLSYFGSSRYPIALQVLREIRSASLVHVHAIDFFSIIWP